MTFLPQMKQIKTKEKLQLFAQVYKKCSGLPIPDAYLYNPDNHVFGIYWKKQLIGGFILGRGPEFRTIEIFAKEDKHRKVYDQLEEKSDYTEICCFWIQRKFRTKTSLNLFVWLAMTYALKRYGTKYFLFGTCSRSLARLYGQTEKSMMIHRDFINKKPTFIFWAKRSSCVTGMLEIISFKLSRMLRISKKSAALTRTRVLS